MLVKKGYVYVLISIVVMAGLGGAFAYKTLTRSPEGVLPVNGWVEGDEVTVSSKVFGRIVRLDIREGDWMEARGVIAIIDSDQLRARMQQAEAQIEAAEKGIQEARENVILYQRQIDEVRVALELTTIQSQARISAAEAALNNVHATLTRTEALLLKARKDYERFFKLHQEKVISNYLLDEKLAAYDVARAARKEAEEGVIQAQANLELAKSTKTEIRLRKKELESAEGRLAIARSGLAAAEARLREAQAKKKEIEADLNDTVIYAPISGRVLDKLVEMGELVVPGTPIGTLLDLSELYVKAYVPEREIGKVRLGNEVRVYVDSFPDRFFMAHVSEIAQEAEFTPKNVQVKDERTKLVYRVKLRINNPEGFLKPGIPADALIKWKDDIPWS